MKLKELRPILWTEQLQETIDFYVTVLGFKCEERSEDWGWAALHRDGVEIMLARPNVHVPFAGPVFTGSFYILTDDVEGMWNLLRDKVKICYPIENFEWNMREFAIYDNNGYMVQFGQEIVS